jgi:hypothetical protein
VKRIKVQQQPAKIESETKTYVSHLPLTARKDALHTDPHIKPSQPQEIVHNLVLHIGGHSEEPIPTIRGGTLYQTRLTIQELIKKASGWNVAYPTATPILGEALSKPAKESGLRGGLTIPTRMHTTLQQPKLTLRVHDDKVSISLSCGLLPSTSGQCGRTTRSKAPEENMVNTLITREQWHKPKISFLKDTTVIMSMVSFSTLNTQKNLRGYPEMSGYSKLLRMGINFFVAPSSPTFWARANRDTRCRSLHL